MTRTSRVAERKLVSGVALRGLVVEVRRQLRKARRLQRWRQKGRPAERRSLASQIQAQAYHLNKAIQQIVKKAISNV